MDPVISVAFSFPLISGSEVHPIFIDLFELVSKGAMLEYSNGRWVLQVKPRVCYGCALETEESVTVAETESL